MSTLLSSACRQRLARVVFIVVGLALWFWTQSLIGSKAPVPMGSGIGDAVLQWTSPGHAWLVANPSAANVLLILSSACIDALGLFIIGITIFGRTLRPFLGLIILFSLRQLCQATTSLPLTEGMIWRDPGVPSLLVTYGVSNDLFFSGHTALAVYGALEVGRLGRPAFVWLAIFIALFEVAAVLLLRAHYTMDVYAGAVTALFVGLIAEKIAVPVDRWWQGRVAQVSA